MLGGLLSFLGQLTLLLSQLLGLFLGRIRRFRTGRGGRFGIRWPGLLFGELVGQVLSGLGCLLQLFACLGGIIGLFQVLACLLHLLGYLFLGFSSLLGGSALQLASGLGLVLCCLPRFLGSLLATVGLGCLTG